MNGKSSLYRVIEFLVIYFLVPISFVLDYSIWLKTAFGFLGLIYVIYVLLKVSKKKFKIDKFINWRLFWKQTFVKFLVIAFLTFLLVYFTNKALLFQVVIQKPLLWIIILFIYSFFSVYPQELIYRTFYFERYQTLFKSEFSLILINAMVFSLCHLFFQNVLVLAITFVGGLLFALTYYKSKSTLLVTIEHAIYGCWLFTVGMGNMLGFPT